MFKRLRIFAPILLVVAALVAPTPAFASAYTGNLAGRPMDGSAGSPYTGGQDCHGIAYGRVQGTLVLFTAAHCAHDISGPYWPVVKAPDGTTLGTFSGGTTGDAHDLSWVVLASGAHPSVLNKVYSNNGSGGYTITAQPTYRIAHIPLYRVNVAIHQAFQTTSTSTYGPNDTGVTEGLAINSDQQQATSTAEHINPPYKDSASPFILSTQLNTIYGFATSANGLVGHLNISLMADGLADINAFLGAGSAYLCTTASC